jgi:hypothetical protein
MRPGWFKVNFTTLDLDLPFNFNYFYSHFCIYSNDRTFRTPFSFKQPDRELQCSGKLQHLLWSLICYPICTPVFHWYEDTVRFFIAGKLSTNNFLSFSKFFFGYFLSFILNQKTNNMKMNKMKFWIKIKNKKCKNSRDQYFKNHLPSRVFLLKNHLKPIA